MTKTEVRGQRSDVREITSQQTRVAVLFKRLGPYHHARLNTAGKAMQVFGIEACGMDQTYAWEKVEGAASFIRLTLTERDDKDASWRKELRRQVWKALDKTKPQAVAVPGWSSTEALSALFWCARTRTPAIMMSESTEWDGRRKPWKEWLKRRLVRLCSAALVGGTPHKDYLVKLGMPAERVFLGYDAVDNGYFADKVAEIRGRRLEVGGRDSEVGSRKSEVSGQWSVVSSQYGLPDRYFLASARFVEKKNLPRLLEAYARYRTLAQRSEAGGQRSEGIGENAEIRTPNSARRVAAPQLYSELRPPTSDLWHLVLLGDGPLKPDLCRLISDLSLQHHVLLPGFKQYDELPVYYGLASAFVHASTTEPWGLVVNEAMASGLPVLVSNRCGCAQDLVKDGVNGFTFDPYDVEQLARLMLRIAGTTDYGTTGQRDSGISQSGRQKTESRNQRSEVRLSAFGDASRKIISHWGPERFASELKSAVEKALEVGPKGRHWVARSLLRALHVH